MTELKTLKDLELWRPVLKSCIIPDNKKLTSENISRMVADMAIKNNLIFDKPDMLPVCANELRQEAIKWIKDLQSSNPSFGILSSFDGPEYQEYNPGIMVARSKELKEKLEVIIGWIRYFFNITEEELK